MKNRRITNRIISWIMTLVMIAGELQLPQLSLTAAAYDIDEAGTCGDSATYSVSGSTLIISGNGAVSDNAFYNKDLSGITGLFIGKDITDIGDSAFLGCDSLRELTFEEGSELTAIGDFAFYKCAGIESVVFPEKLLMIGNSAFEDCALKEITLYKGLKEIGNYAFAGNNLSYIHFMGSGKEWDAIEKGIGTHTGIVDFSEGISYAVIFKVKNGYWNKGVNDDIVIYKYGDEGDTFKLDETDIPAVGANPFEHYSEGSWDTVPEADTVINSNRTYTYCYEPEDISVIVTFKVKNGSWDDGTKEDKFVTLKGKWGSTFIPADQLPVVGSRPDEHYAEGSWDIVPKADEIIYSNCNYTYSYEPDNFSANVTFRVKNGSWDDGTKEDKSLTVNGIWGSTFLTADQLPAVGSRPDEDCHSGRWDNYVLSTGSPDGDVVLTYSYEKNSGLGTDAILNPAAPGNFSDTNTWTGSYVYFGSYKAENQTDAAPVKYRVLDNHAVKFGGHTMLLDGDTVLFKSAFNPKTDADRDKWKDSIAYKALNTNEDSFLNTAFTSVEQNAIANSTIDSHPYTSVAVNEGDVAIDPTTVARFQNYTALTGEKIFLLDIEDASNTAYGYGVSYANTDSHRIKNTLTTEAAWRLRSPYLTSAKNICLVTAAGKFYSQNTVNVRGMSPALNIDLSSVIKVTQVASEQGAYKLMITDKGLGIALTEGSLVTITDNKVTVPFTVTDNSETAAPGRVSVIVTDGSWGENGWSEGAELLQYAQLDMDSFALSGEGAFTLDAAISGEWGKDYHVYLIAEDINGEKETDYASAPLELPASSTKKAISAKVTFKVVNGSWNNGTKEDKTVTLNGYEGDELKLSADDIPAAGNKPDASYMTGAWDVTPSVNTVITGDTVYTYSYVKKAAATVTTAPAAKTLTYNGKEQELVTAGVADGGTMVYSLSESGTFTATIPSAKDAGTYTVYYKVNGDDTHEDSAAASIEVTIARKAVTVTADNRSKNYGTADPELTATVSGTIGSDTVNYTISRAAGEEAGTYAIIVTGAANQGNYSVSFVNGTFTIIRVKAAVTAAPEAKSLSYNGSAQELVKAGIVSGGNMVYATGSSSAPSTAWSEEIPTGVNAGVYYVWYKALGDAGYEDSDMNCVSVLIAKAAQAAPAAPVKQSSSENRITLVSHEGYEYKCGEGSWQSSASFNGLEADTEYTFYQRISGDENHEASPASEGAKFKTDAPAPTPTEEDKPTPTVSDNEPTPTVSDNTPTPTVTPTPGPLPTFGPTPTPIPVPEEPAEMSFVFANGTDTFSTEYTGSAIKPEILGYCGSRLLAEGKDYTVSYSRNVNAGKATVSVRGKNDYSGTYKLSFTIDPKQIAGENGTAAKGIVVSGLTVQGDKAVKPVIYYNGAEVKKGINTKVSKAADGTETVDLVANGQNFTGELKGLPVYRINDKEEFEKTAIKVELGKVNRVYDGTPQLLGENDLKVTDQAGNKLTEGEDYAVSYSADVINAGTVKVQVTGIGNYTGSKAISYKIAPATDAAISVQLIPEEGMPEGSYSYSKNKVTPAVFVAAKVNDHTNVLSEGIDYTLKYSNNAKAGATGKIKISFTGNYKGTTAQEIGFTIEKASLETAEIFAGDILYKKAGNYKAKPVVTVNGKVVASSEYTVSYSISGNEMPKKLKLADDENEKIITVTVKSKGRSFTDGTKELSTTYRVYRDTKTGISKAKISLVVKDGTKALKNVAYTGSPVTFDPSNKNRQGDIKVKIGKTVLTGAQVFENFDVTYADNIEKGKATIILTAKESSPYSGMRTVTFKIVKRKVK